MRFMGAGGKRSVLMLGKNALVSWSACAWIGIGKMTTVHVVIT